MAKKIAELDILGEAHIPSDLLTPTLGSNYGLDGYPDMEYGAGVLEGVLNPEFTESPALPTGLTKSGAEGEMDLTAFMEDSLSDLAWLDPTQLQDPERLPETPDSIPELEEAWGVDRRTDGVHVHASRDLTRARYEDSLDKAPEKKKANTRSLTQVLRRAMARSAAGHDIDAVTDEARLYLGKNASRVRNILARIKDEHGLAGNVFIRASAYPGYEQGKWSKQLRKTSARYVLVSPDQLKTASWIQDGRCAYTGKLAVAEVPWEEAYAFYKPRFAAQGIRVRRGSEELPGAREALRAAFLYERPDPVADSTYRPKHDPSLREGFLAEPAEKKVYDKQAGRVDSGVNKIARAIQKGAYGDHLRTLIRRTFRDEDLKLAVKKLTPMLTATKALEGREVKRASYEGPEYHAHSMTRVASLGDSEARPLSKVASGALQWIRRSMSEGFAGRDLDSLIHHRFASAVLSEIEEPLAEARKAHEGGAGFLYVDASAYASPTGVKGCEKGALRHRANQIPVVAAMARCADCSLARTLSDGTRKCGTYNKTLLEDTTGPEVERVKKANIRVADMNDAEQTAAIFMTPENAFDPHEFSLRNSNLEEVEVDLPENEKVAEITFGGWDL